MYDENDCNHGPEGSDYNGEAWFDWRKDLKCMVLALLAIFMLVGIFFWPSYRREANAEPYLIEASVRIKQAVHWRAEGEFTSAQAELERAKASIKEARITQGRRGNGWKKIYQLEADMARAAALTRDEARKLRKKIKDRREKLLNLPE
ncbi:hypothetical protein A2303_02140 [Candidatus Falkowbacteria bacterium RIFOXYB2_FULL_47_14]|uniref:DUF4398 domain-containing protein n=1 Tax=Candidatus Falkowbacteria bacterium RIFOXYA2_FULL_47_19 TaxID=1797994 RepID=A0A1F5SEH7_9BACT|nr:MAG: hypothetical protein A2227_07320 [Candidatus Falkowbacteria bacterium RIFOXYA2_FULL_47_19]OGF35227.1 MAG: hypothetical protein A2468_00945 [Candidatus Falkowbacteria bacterium RIFOXYC2_FULL_46_15]OGF43867.1 MAG: hypothetical protein A2303_02140 [Candidatus Falkowbacteria bacterium RIFOXYB2_FULL_47_14]